MADSSTTRKHGFWELKKYREHEWFWFLVVLITLIGVLYLASHIVMQKFNEKAGYEYERLNPRQLQHINTIYFDTLNIVASAVSPEGLLAGEASGDLATRKESARIRARQGALNDSLKCARVLTYIQHEFNNKVDRDQLEGIRSYLCSARPLEAISFLATFRLQVKSYFWLTGPEVYFEIFFWSWFGVICSILFNLGMVARNVTTNPRNPHTVFDSTEIPSQFAKLIYAPLCTLIIVLGYNFFSDQNIVDISSSKGLIVFSFIGGYYCARLIAFLDRLKEVILPISSTPELPVQKTPDQIRLQNIRLELELDAQTLPAELISEVAEIGLDEAVVSLQDSENGDLVSAVKTAEDQGFTFLVNDLKPGEYTITVSWSKEVNGEPLNLVATQTEKIMHSDRRIVVLLRKAEAEG